jgi:FdhD protein
MRASAPSSRSSSMSAKPSPADPEPPAVPPPAPVADVEVTRWRGGRREALVDRVAEETPVAVQVNGEPHAVMLMSPCDLEDFALGFAFTEGLIERPQDLLLVETRALDDGIELDLCLPLRAPRRADAPVRSLPGRAGCGICGKAMIEDALRVPPPVPQGATIGRAAIARAAQALNARQPLNRETGGVHAAAWVGLDGAIIAVREDIGRHNALDKLIGARLRGHFPPGFVLLTCRASYEVVMKAAVAGIGLLAAFSAPTARAVRLAEHCQVTLAAFVRGADLVLYAHPSTLVDDIA